MRPGRNPVQVALASEQMGMRATRALLFAAVAAVAAAAAACSDSTAADSGGRLRVVTTVSPITNIVANIAGDRADVTGLVPEGTNSHTFEPPPSAAKALARADVLFVNGLKLEDPTQDLAEQTLAPGARTVRLGDAVLDEDGYIYDFSFPRSEGKPNPHLWTNPPMAAAYAKVVRDTLVDLDPAGTATYDGNLRAFTAKVDALDAAMRAATATLPPERRTLLTYHDAYAYFAREYGWRVVGAIQVSDFDEPTARELAALIDQVRRERVPAIFGSEVFPSPVLAQIGREAGVRYVDELRDDDLPGEPGDPTHSYLGLMQHDFVTMVRALGGDPSALEDVDVADVAATRARYPQ